MALTKATNRMTSGAKFNVLDYGASNDGTNASATTTAIQAAIDAAKAQGGGHVYLPAGKYLVNSTIDLTGGQSLIISGDGQGDRRYNSGYDFGTSILTTGVHGFDLSNAGTGTSRTFQVNIRDLNIQRLNEDNTGNGIHKPEDLVNFTGVVHIENVSIFSFENGIFARRAGWFYINQCSLQNNTNGADIEGNIIGVTNSKIIQNGQYSGSDQVNMNASLLSTIPFGLRISANAATVTGCDLEDNAIGLVIDTGSDLVARAQVTVTGCYFESHSKQALWCTNSTVSFNGIYSNNNTYDKFYFFNSNANIDNSYKLSIINAASNIDLTESGYLGITETLAWANGSSGIPDYTAAYPIKSIHRPGIPDDVYGNPVQIFGYAKEPISDNGFSTSNATDTLNVDVNYNPLEKNSRSLVRSSTNGYVRKTLSSGAVTADEYFSITLVGQAVDFSFMTWKLYDLTNNALIATSTPNLNRDDNGVFTLQIWGKGVAADSLYLYLYPGGEAQGTGTETFIAYGYGVIVTDRRPIEKLPLGDIHIWYDNAAPTAGRHVQGEIVYYKYPAAGGHMGVVCTATGTPGTWKTFGAITA